MAVPLTSIQEGRDLKQTMVMAEREWRREHNGLVTQDMNNLLLNKDFLRLIF